MRWAGKSADMGQKMRLYKVLVRKSVGKRALGRLRHKERLILK
jgi:hypothetical protein